MNSLPSCHQSIETTQQLLECLFKLLHAKLLNEFATRLLYHIRWRLAIQGKLISVWDENILSPYPRSMSAMWIGDFHNVWPPILPLIGIQSLIITQHQCTEIYRIKPNIITRIWQLLMHPNIHAKDLWIVTAIFDHNSIFFGSDPLLSGLFSYFDGDLQSDLP